MRENRKENKEKGKESRPAYPWSLSTGPMMNTRGETKQEKLQRTEEGTNVKITPW